MSWKLRFSLILLLLTTPSYAVTEFDMTVCSSGCDYTAFSTAEAVGDLNLASATAVKCGTATVISGTIPDATAVTWDSGASSGTLEHQSSTEYMVSVAAGTLDAGDTVTDATNSFTATTVDTCSVKIECQQNGTITDTVDFNGGTYDSDNNVLLTVASGFRHDGTTSQGCRINNTATNQTIEVLDDFVTVEWLIISESVNHASTLSCFNTSTGATGVDNKVLRNVIVPDCINPGAGVYDAVVMQGSNFGSDNNFVGNNIIYNSEDEGIVWNGVVSADDIEIYNNTIDGCAGNGIETSANGAVTVKNNIVTNSGASDYSGTIDTGAKNISEDTTGSAGLTGINPDNEYVSISSRDYHLKAGAVAIDKAVIVPGTNVQYDIDNYDRTTNAGNVWDAGADEYLFSDVIHNSVWHDTTFK